MVRKRLKFNLPSFVIRYLLLVFVAIPDLWIFYTIFTPLTVYPVYFISKIFFSASLSNSIILLNGQVQNTATGAGGPGAVCAARPHGDGGESGVDLRVDLEQEAGGGAGCAGAGCEDRLGRFSAQDGGRGVPGGIDGGDCRGCGNTHGGAADGHEPAAGRGGGKLD